MPGDEPISPEEPRHGQTPGPARVLPSKQHEDDRARSAVGIGPGLPPQVTSGLEHCSSRGIRLPIL